MKRFLIFLLASSPAFAQGPGDVTIEYDRFKKQTVVSLVGMSLGNLDVMSLYVMPGRTPSKPSVVSLNVSAGAESWRYLKCHELSLLVDDVPIQTSSARHDGDVGNGRVSERISVILSVASVQRIASGKSVEMRLCNSEFAFSALQTAQFRAFLEPMIMTSEAIMRQSIVRQRWSDSLSALFVSGRSPVLGWQSSKVFYSGRCALWRLIPVSEIVFFANEDAAIASGFRSASVQCDT